MASQPGKALSSSHIKVVLPAFEEKPPMPTVVKVINP
jgi:hypothetical protein